MQRKHFWNLLLLFSFPAVLLGQVYVDGGNTRHRFAQLTLGADFLVTPGGGQVNLLENGSLTPYETPDMLHPRLQVGGTHFWGHAEIYVAFALGNLLDNTIRPASSISYSPGVETGFKVYPWRLERGKLRPYLGTALAIPAVRLRPAAAEVGPFISQRIAPLNAGLTYQTGNILIEAGLRYHTGSDLSYPLDRERFAPFQWARWGIFGGIRYTLETTISAEKPYQNGDTDQLVALLKARKRLSGFSLAIGPSSSFVLGRKRGTYNEGARAFIGQHEGSGVFPDMGIGYYHAPWDMHLNLAYRSYGMGRFAYGYRQLLRRRAVTLEAYKFLFDYHGFVPFIGPALSYERWGFRELDDRVETLSLQDEGLRPGITFGWDIRPDEAQSFILRTNLRYTPFTLDTPGNTMLFLHSLEFNFIQLVLYPGRIAAKRKIARGK